MQLIASKLYISPLPADLVLRPQLIRKLGQVHRYKLTVLSAPAGFGKTTLLGSWFREMTDKTLDNINGDSSVRLQPCWLSLDQEDNEPERFLESLLTACDDSGISLDTAAAYLPINSATSYRSALNALFYDLSNSQNDIVLIFDDYYFIENREVHELVQQLISRAPLTLHLLVSTRIQPPFETGKLRVSGQLLEIGPADLRFTLEEAKEYLHLAQKFSLTEKDVATIAKKTEGWIAGLKMAALSIQNSEDPAVFVKAFNGSHRYIFDYLVEQVLVRQPPDVKEFLLATSVVESFNAPLYDALIQDGNYPPGTSRRILTYLEQANLFIVPLDDERQWYRYHHLFAELLRSVLQQTSPEKIVKLQRYACDWYERNHMIPDAVNLAITAGDIERAARMISTNVLLLVEQTELKTILHRLDRLFSSGQAISNPWMHIAYVWTLVFSGEVKRAANTFRQVETLAFDLPNSRDRNELDGNLCAIQAYIQWVNGYHFRSIELARQAAEHLSTSNSAVRALNLATLASVLQEVGRYEEALQSAQQAVDIGNAIGQSNIVMLAMGSLAYVYHDMGQIDKSSAICEQALEQADIYRRRNGRILPSAAVVYAVQGINFFKQHDLDKACLYARRGVALSEIWGQADTIYITSLIMARLIYWIKNEQKEALEILERAEQMAKRTSEWFLHMVKVTEGRIQFDCGNMGEARRIVRELEEFNRKTDLDLTRFHLLSTLAVRVWIKDQQYEMALKNIDQSLERYKDPGGLYRIMMLLLRASVYQKMGNGNDAISTLETALQYAQSELQVAPFIGMFQQLEEPLKFLATKEKHKKFIEHLFAVQLEQTSNPASQQTMKHTDTYHKAEGLIEPLTERELEILRLLNSHLPTPEIADMLAVSVNTVRTHIKSIYAKIGVHSRSTAIALAKELKLLS